MLRREVLDLRIEPERTRLHRLGHAAYVCGEASVLTDLDAWWAQRVLIVAADVCGIPRGRSLAVVDAGVETGRREARR